MCFDVNIEIMTQNCLKSRHFQAFFLKHGALISINPDLCRSFIPSPFFVKYFVKVTALGDLHLHKNTCSEKFI